MSHLSSHHSVACDDGSMMSVAELFRHMPMTVTREDHQTSPNGLESGRDKITAHKESVLVSHPPATGLRCQIAVHILKGDCAARVHIDLSAVLKF